MRKHYIPAFPKLGLVSLFGPRVPSQVDIFSSSSTISLSSARAAAFHSIRLLGIAAPFKVLVPAYHCGVEIEALLRAGVEIEYYAVGKNTVVDPDEVLRTAGPSVKALFLVHYWGFPQDIDALRKVCTRRGVLLIEDCAHALFSEDGREQLGTRGDAALYSLPKTLPAPDGGLLRLAKEPIAALRIRDGNHLVALKAGLRSMLERTRAKGNGHRSRMADAALQAKERARSDHVGGLEDFGETELSGYFRGMSFLSRRVFERSVAESIRSRRRRNFMFLLERFSGESAVRPLYRDLPEGTCPLFFPIRVTEREKLERHLREARVGTFVFGRNLHPTLDRGCHPDAHYLSRHVLGLPVHQDLEEEDMIVVAEKTFGWVHG